MKACSEDVLMDLLEINVDLTQIDPDTLSAFIDAQISNRQINARLRSLNKMADQIKLGIMFITQQLQDGKLTPAMWEAEMRKELKALHIIAAATARGGFDELDFRIYGHIGSNLKKEYAYLKRFRDQIEQGKIKLDGNGILRRAASYTVNSRQSFYVALRQATYTQERRILAQGVAHCQDCLDEARKGWQSVGTLKVIGDSQCRTNCHCRMEFR